MYDEAILKLQSIPLSALMLIELKVLARQIAESFAATSKRIVLAESCTAGLVVNQLSRVPGASDWLCGAMVVYRNASKVGWLGVSQEAIDDPRRGPVSFFMAENLCERLLVAAPEADIALSIVGHLGPDAPKELDGIVFVGIMVRGAAATVESHRLARELPADSPFDTLREYRQYEAAHWALRALHAAITS